MFNSTVELNKTYILPSSTVRFISFTISMKQNNYLIVQEALQGATDYSFNSTVKLNKTYILSNSTVGFISFTIGMTNRLTNSTVGTI